MKIFIDLKELLEVQVLPQRVEFDEKKRVRRGLEDHRMLGICIGHVPNFDQSFGLRC